MKQIKPDTGLSLEEIVYTTVNHSGVFTDTKRIADALGLKHSNVMRKADRLAKIQRKGQLNFETSSYLSEQNKQLRMWRIDKAGSLALLLSFNGEKFDRLRLSIANKFVDQEEELLHWRSSRQTLKHNHLEFTDKIKPLADLLRKEDSRQWSRIYSTIQLQVNKAVTGRPTPRGIEIGAYRESLSEIELDNIQRIEDTVFVIVDHFIENGGTGRATRNQVKDFLHSDMVGCFVKSA